MKPNFYTRGIILTFMLFALNCSNDMALNRNIVISYGDSEIYNYKEYNAERRDSALNAGLKNDSFGIIFETGFDKTKVRLSVDDNTAENLMVTTNLMLGVATYRTFKKVSRNIYLEIEDQKYRLNVLNKYLFIMLNYERSEKKLFVEYTNEIPKYY